MPLLKRIVVIILLVLLSCYSGNDINTNYEKQVVNDFSTEFVLAGRGKIDISGFWSEPPDIVICDRITTVAKITNALNFWRRIGYSFGSITIVDDIIACSSVEYNKIKIMLPTNIDMKNNLAITRLYRHTPSKQNLYAVISIYPFTANKKLVLEHELGHALGWRHYNQKMHIMFPRYESLGNHSQDVRYSDYLYHQKTSSSE